MDSNGQPDELNLALKSIRVQFFTAFIFSTIANALLLTSPLFMLLIYDRVLSSRSTETLVSLLIIVAMLFMVMALLDYARRRLLARIGAKLQQRLESTVFDLAHRPVHVANSLSKDTAVLSALDCVRKFFNSPAPMAVFDVLSTPIFLGIVFLFHYVIGWMGVVGVIILIIVLRLGEVVSARKTDLAKAASGKSSNTNRLVKSAMGTVRSQGMVGSVKQRWLAAREDARIHAIALHDQKIWFSVVAKSTRMLLLSSVLATGAYFVLQGQLTICAMIACSVMLNRVFMPIETFMKQIPMIVTTIGHWKVLRARLSDDSASAALVPTRAVRSKVDVRNICVHCPYTNEPILQDVSFELLPGKVTQISGASGSGKTVLAQTIRGLFPFTEGEVRLDGEKIEHFSEQYLSDFFGFLPQQILFIPGTIEENICGMEPKSKAKAVIAAARKARTHRFIKNLPNGYKTVLDQEGSRFSEGQRRQIALARALYRNPRILIVDDVDSVFARRVSGDVKKLQEDICQSGGHVVLLTRDSKPLKTANVLIELDEGRIVSSREQTGSNVEKLAENNVSEFAVPN